MVFLLLFFLFNYSKLGLQSFSSAQPCPQVQRHLEPQTSSILAWTGSPSAVRRMVVMVALPQGQTLRSRCRFSVEVYPEAVQRHPLSESGTTKSTAVAEDSLSSSVLITLMMVIFQPFWKADWFFSFASDRRYFRMFWQKGEKKNRSHEKKRWHKCRYRWLFTTAFVRFYNKQTTHNHLKG